MVKHMVIVLLVLLSLLAVSDAWWRRRAKPKPGRRHAYYFGTQNLNCLLKLGKGKGKRGYPSRFTLSWSHRLIKYRGKVYDWDQRGGHSRPLWTVRGCGLKWERKPAAYSGLSTSCMDKCARSARRKYGKYRFLTNNCHKFANRMSQILYSNRCPSWCR